MDNMYIEKLRKEVKRALKTDKMRFRHTIGVADSMSESHPLSVFKARLTSFRSFQCTVFIHISILVPVCDIYI